MGGGKVFWGEGGEVIDLREDVSKLRGACPEGGIGVGLGDELFDVEDFDVFNADADLGDVAREEGGAFLLHVFEVEMVARANALEALGAKFSE
jgi:hypothetical protein